MTDRRSKPRCSPTPGPPEDRTLMRSQRLPDAAASARRAAARAGARDRGWSQLQLARRGGRVAAPPGLRRGRPQRAQPRAGARAGAARSTCRCATATRCCSRPDTPRCIADRPGMPTRCARSTAHSTACCASTSRTRRWCSTATGTCCEANDAAPRLFGRFVDLAARPRPRNLLHLVFDPQGLRPHIANWPRGGARPVRAHRARGGGWRARRTACVALRRGTAWPTGCRHRLGGGRAASGAGPVIPIDVRDTTADRLSYFSLVVDGGHADRAMRRKSCAWNACSPRTRRPRPWHGARAGESTCSGLDRAPIEVCRAGRAA